MTHFIAGNTAVENALSLAQSALPNAPQQPYDEPVRNAGDPLAVQRRTAHRRRTRTPPSQPHRPRLHLPHPRQLTPAPFAWQTTQFAWQTNEIGGS